jgi:multidrug transporter EmrE-like cation transporter
LILIKNFKTAANGSFKIGILSAALAGGLIAIFVIFLNRAYATEKIAIITPVVFGGSILLSSILSFFIYKERIAPLQLLGLSLVLAGIALIIISKLKA